MNSSSRLCGVFRSVRHAVANDRCLRKPAVAEAPSEDKNPSLHDIPDCKHHAFSAKRPANYVITFMRTRPPVRRQMI